MQQSQEEKRRERAKEHCREWNWCCDCCYRGEVVNGEWTCAMGLDWKKIKQGEE